MRADRTLDFTLYRTSKKRSIPKILRHLSAVSLTNSPEFLMYLRFSERPYEPLVSRRAANCYTTRCIISDHLFLSTILSHKMPIRYALDISSNACARTIPRLKRSAKTRPLRTCSIKTTPTITRIQSGPKTWGNQRKAADFGPALKPFQKNRPAHNCRNTVGHSTYVLSLMSTPKNSHPRESIFSVRYTKPLTDIPNYLSYQVPSLIRP